MTDSRGDYWEGITFEDVIKIIQDIAPLIKYKRATPVPKITLDIDDVVKQRKIIEFGPPNNEKQEYVEVYREKVEREIKELAKSHPTFKKIKDNRAITETDIKKLETTLNGPELFVTEEALFKWFNNKNVTI